MTSEELKELNKSMNALEKFIDELPEKALGFGIRVLLAALIFFVGVRLIKIIRKVLKKSLTRANVEIGVIQFLDGLVKALLYVVLVLAIAGNFGFDATSIVAILGSAGVAVGLALQGSLSNIAGGVLILVLKPFRVGDYIKEHGNGNEGTVKEIGIIYTKLSMPDGRVVVLPNGNLANNSITNATDVKVRRIDFSVGISYDANIAQAKKVISNVIESDDDVIKKDEIKVYVDSLGSSEVVIGVRCYCENANYLDTRWRLLENVKLALDDADIEIPYPQLSVHMMKKD